MVISKSRKKAGKALLIHLHEYEMKGFHIRSVTSDNEGAIKAVKPSIKDLGIEVYVQGHGTHIPHAESAIRHVKNKARAVLHGLQFPLPSKLAAALRLLQSIWCLRLINQDTYQHLLHSRVVFLICP
jgi:hypothetical protein